MITRLEALADAITDISGYHTPESAVYKARNPGALRAYSQTVLSDLDNYRVFSSFRAGYDALIFDLKTKCAGKSHTHLETTSTLKELILTNGFEPALVKKVVNFLRRALEDQEFSEATTLSFFLEA